MTAALSRYPAAPRLPGRVRPTGGKILALVGGLRFLLRFLLPSREALLVLLGQFALLRRLRMRRRFGRRTRQRSDFTRCGASDLCSADDAVVLGVLRGVWLLRHFRNINSWPVLTIISTPAIQLRWLHRDEGTGIVTVNDRHQAV